MERVRRVLRADRIRRLARAVGVARRRGNHAGVRVVDDHRDGRQYVMFEWPEGEVSKPFVYWSTDTTPIEPGDRPVLHTDQDIIDFTLAALEGRHWPPS